MKTSTLFLSSVLALGSTRAGAQIVLDEFTAGTQPREGVAQGSWIGNATQNLTTLTIAGTAHDDNGWGVFNLLPVFDATGLQLTVIAQRNDGHLAGSFNIQFFDEVLGSQAFSISSSSFVTGSLSTVNIPLGPWVTADPTRLNGWSIGGGNFIATGPDFRMTFDQMSLTPAAIPEPAALAAVAACAVLGFAVWRRRTPKV